MPYTPLALANEFLVKADGEGLDHMKIQKLAYYAYGWWLAYHPNEPLLSEGPELWKFGPVFAGLYRVLATHGPKTIVGPQKAVPFGVPPMLPDQGADNIRNLVDWIWDRYGGLDSFTLSDMTHAKGTPWQIEAERYNYRVPVHHRIPDSLIAECFKREADTLESA